MPESLISTEKDSKLDQALYMSEESSVLEKAMEILKIAIPSSLCYVVIMAQELINLFFIGKLNNAEQLAAIGLGNMIVNIAGLSIFLGLNTAM
jgi:MATE family multidrug resistance protein